MPVLYPKVFVIAVAPDRGLVRALRALVDNKRVAVCPPVGSLVLGYFVRGFVLVWSSVSLVSGAGRRCGSRWGSACCLLEGWLL